MGKCVVYVGCWFINKNWLQLFLVELCIDKFYFFIIDLKNLVDICFFWKMVRIYLIDRFWIMKRIKMLIKKWQIVFICDGKDFVFYRFLRNKVYWEIRLVKYDYYYYKVSDFEQMDLKKWWR